MKYNMLTANASVGRISLTLRDCFYAMNVAMASLISYSISRYGISPFVDASDSMLAGLWATVATVFVFRTTLVECLSASIGRLIATSVSVAMCIAYLVVFPFHPMGLAALLGVGTLIIIAMDRRDDIATFGITTVVVLVVASTRSQHPWHQPLLRLVDTVVGIIVGLLCMWIDSALHFWMAGKVVAIKQYLDHHEKTVRRSASNQGERNVRKNEP